MGIPYHAIRYDTILYIIIPCHTMAYYTILYYTFVFVYHTVYTVYYILYRPLSSPTILRPVRSSLPISRCLKQRNWPYHTNITYHTTHYYTIPYQYTKQPYQYTKQRLSCKIGVLIYFNLFFEMYNKKWKFLNLVNLFWSNFIWNNWNEKESMEHAAPYVAATSPPPPSALFLNKTNFITKKKITILI